jgi:hypothetical protein
VWGEEWPSTGVWWPSLHVASICSAIVWDTRLHSWDEAQKVPFSWALCYTWVNDLRRGQDSPKGESEVRGWGESQSVGTKGTHSEFPGTAL